MTGPDRLNDVLSSSPHRPLDQRGRIEVYRGQRFDLIGERPHVTKDGRSITLLTWRSPCLDCGKPFEMTTVAHAPTFKPNARRCTTHRSSRRPAWRDRVAETDPVVAARPLPDGRPVSPVEVYEDQRK